MTLHGDQGPGWLDDAAHSRWGTSAETTAAITYGALYQPDALNWMNTLRTEPEATK